jgi:predicted nucleic acid-binding protein
MNLTSETRNVVIDASVLVALCAQEPGRCALADAALEQRDAAGCTVYAPHLIVMETLYVLCNKHIGGELSADEYASAVANLRSSLAAVKFLPEGDAALIARAERIRHGYGCSRSADSLYLALTELLAVTGRAELLTFDAGQRKQAAAVAPSVTVILLPNAKV